ncbi:MAG: cation:proton antiporter [Candidatus Diapherotrites archaeon]|nr:cation:proton antiporter [Candidatus Diapherotrites archaeon]
MVSVESSFLLVAVIIFIGFFGLVLFNKTKISDVLILMLLGIIIGPILGWFDDLTMNLIRSLAPFFASLVLIMLLFEGGLKLNFFRVIRELKAAAVFTVLVFAVSTIIVASIMQLFGWSIIEGLLLGAIIGGTSSTIVIPLISRMKTKPETKIMLSLESAISDALCIVVTLALLQIAVTTTVDFQQIGQEVLAAFSIAAVLGALVALLWLSLLRDIKKLKERQYILTIAVLFTLFFIVEFVGSNGAIAALVFGLVLGNSREIMKFLKMREIALDTNIPLFQNEISFFIRTFYFIYIGVLFELSFLNMNILLLAIALGLSLLAARIIVTSAAIPFFKTEREDAKLIAIMMPRGLAAAVLASYPLTFGLNLDFAMQTIQIVFLIILLSNIITSIGVIAISRASGKGQKKKVETKDALEEIKIGVKEPAASQ